MRTDAQMRTILAATGESHAGFIAPIRRVDVVYAPIAHAAFPSLSPHTAVSRETAVPCARSLFSRFARTRGRP
ncbi:hypothetical protein GCM10009863_02420 [Streptomyces axinellae]|uniref:Uncharacterized protein n=1 Tax=Streptomyces axinellae TaxID=552788 RepID=A0ABP6C347_9ACTN